MSLLSNAKKIPANHYRNESKDELVELAYAWAKDEIQLGQVAKALKGGTTAAYIQLAIGLRQFIRNNNL